MDLTEEQRRELVRRVVQRVVERLRAEETAARTKITSSSAVASPSSSLVPCAIPPPGSARYESILAQFPAGIDSETGGGPFVEDAEVAEAEEIERDSLADWPSLSLVGSGVFRLGVDFRNLTDLPSAYKSTIDLTLLGSGIREREIVSLCEQARAGKFAAVCVEGRFATLCSGLLKKSGVKVVSLVGYPAGGWDAETKLHDARNGAASGADEIDVFIPTVQIARGELESIMSGLLKIKAACLGRPVKVVVEASRLSDDQRVAIAVLARAAGCIAIKPSLIWASDRVGDEALRLMHHYMTLGRMATNRP